MGFNSAFKGLITFFPALFLIFELYVLFVLCLSLYCLCVYVLLPPVGYPVAVKHIISNRAFYEIMWKNMIYPDRSQITI